MGGGKFGTPECRDSTNSHGEGLAAGEMGEHHGAARGDKWVKAVFWLCIFCIGSAVSLHRGPCCMEEAQPELCLLEPTEELASAREGGCKRRGPGWWEGSGAGGGEWRTSPTSPGSMCELSVPSQKPWWGHGHTPLSSGREEKGIRAGWSKDGSGLGCARSHAMGLESLPRPRVLGQTDFCQAASDWALKALASSFCRPWPFSAEVHPHCHMRGVKCK